MINFKTWMENQQIIYHDKTGIIKGYIRPDGYWWIEEFEIYPEYRKKGLSKNLATHLPAKCKLLAYPLFNKQGEHISQKDLIKFYESLGFKLMIDELGNSIMQRG